MMIAVSNIHKFFKKSLCEDTTPIFRDYPDIANDNDAFEEVKKLRQYGRKHLSSFLKLELLTVLKHLCVIVAEQIPFR
jgi:hypothetical protein